MTDQVAIERGKFTFASDESIVASALFSTNQAYNLSTITQKLALRALNC